MLLNYSFPLNIENNVQDKIVALVEYKKKKEVKFVILFSNCRSILTLGQITLGE